MYIEKVTLRNVRQFKKTTFEFKPGFNLLVGENGSGKTTVLQSLHVALGPKNTALKRPQLRAEDIRLQSKELEIKVEFDNEFSLSKDCVYSKRFGRRSSRKGGQSALVCIFFKSNESIAEGLKSRVKRQFSSGNQRKTAQLEEYLYESTGGLEIEVRDGERFGRSSEIRRFVLDALMQLSKRFNDFGWRLEPYDCQIKPISKNIDLEVIARKADLKQLSSLIMRHLQERKNPFTHFDQRSIRIDSNGRVIGANSSDREIETTLPSFRELLENEVEFFNSPRLLDSIVAEIKLTPQIVIKGPDGDLLLSQLSDGEQRIFSLIVDIARQLSVSSGSPIQETPAVVMIDEIDVHLHPKWQRKIVPTLEDLFPNCQFIASTHSPFVIQSVDLQKIIQPNRDNAFHMETVTPSIEDIVEDIQGVDTPQRSIRAERLSTVAEHYFNLLRSPNASAIQLEAAERDYRLASEPYTSSPAANALLKIEKLLAERK